MILLSSNLSSTLTEATLLCTAKMPLLDAADFAEMKNAWNNRYNGLFQKKVTDQFVSELLDCAAEKDIKAHLMQSIALAREPKDLWVSLGVFYPDDAYFTAEGFGNRRMTIKQILYRTDALQQLAAFIGKDIKVRPLFDQGVFFIKIEYWPSFAVAHINNPEDE